MRDVLITRIKETDQPIPTLGIPSFISLQGNITTTFALGRSSSKRKQDMRTRAYALLSSMFTTKLRVRTNVAACYKPIPLRTGFLLIMAL